MFFVAVNPGDVSGSPFLLIFVLLILLLQLLERRVRLWSLILVPALMLAVTSASIYDELIGGWLNLAIICLGFVAGCGVGAAIASQMKVSVDARGVMLLRGSVIAVGLWAVVLLAKFYGKPLLGATGLVDFDLLTSALLAVTLGTMIARRVFVYRRYLQLKQPGNAEKKE